MDSAALRAAQQPLKAAYREQPQEALVTLRAHGDLGEQSISCSVATGKALTEAGLHPLARPAEMTVSAGHASLAGS